MRPFTVCPAQVYGFFTFINTLWLVAIIGIAVSIAPSVYHILKPLRALLKRWARLPNAKR